MIDVTIDIRCRNREEAEMALRDIACAIGNGRYHASCSKADQEEVGGTVFVATLDSAR